MPTLLSFAVLSAALAGTPSRCATKELVEDFPYKVSQVDVTSLEQEGVTHLVGFVVKPQDEPFELQFEVHGLNEETDDWELLGNIRYRENVPRLGKALRANGGYRIERPVAVTPEVKELRVWFDMSTPSMAPGGPNEGKANTLNTPLVCLHAPIRLP